MRANQRPERPKLRNDNSAARTLQESRFAVIRRIESAQRRMAGRCVLVVTAIPAELTAALEALGPLSGRHKIMRAHCDLTYYVGMLGTVQAVVAMSGMGSTGRDGSALIITSAIEKWKPCAIVMVGIAFGKDPAKQGAGDVLVSSQIICYEPQRLGVQPINRGAIVESGSILLDRFRNATVDWSFREPGQRQSQLHVGPILSGEKLIDNASFKADLFARYPQAIGGEMEAAGLCAAAGRAQIEWIVVKGVSDWADGAKADTHHKYAAQAAVSLIKHVFSSKAVAASLMRDLMVPTPVAPSPNRREPRSEHREPSETQAIHSSHVHPMAGPRLRAPDERSSSIGSERGDVVASLLAHLDQVGSSRVLVVSGAVGSAAVSVTKRVLSELPYLCVSISLSDIVAEPLFGQSSHEVALLHRVAAGLGADRTPAFGEVWKKYEKCFNVVRYVRTMIEHSGYDSLCRGLQSLDRLGGVKRRSADPLLILKRVLSGDEEVELLVRPQRHMFQAISRDLTALSGRTILHFFDLDTVPEAPLVSVIQTLAGLPTGSLGFQILVSLEAHPLSYPLLRQCRTFHVPRASRSEVLQYLSEIAASGAPEHGQGLVDVEFIGHLSGGSLVVAEFLRNHTRLVGSLKRLECNRDSEGSIKTAAEAWCLLAVAYHVTPNLLSETLALTEAEATSLAEEIPDERDGGRRLPTEVAGAIVAASSFFVVSQANKIILDHLERVAAEVEEKWSAPSPTYLALGFHSAWHSGTIAVIDRCLLRSFRTSLSLCAHLYAALTRLQAIGSIAEATREKISERLAVIERIDEGCCSDDRVVHFFENLTENNKVDFSRAERAVAYYQLGHAYRSVGELEIAAAALGCAVDLDGEYYNAWSLLGIVYGDLDKMRDAIVALREAIKLKGDYEFAQFNLGVVLEGQGELREAVKCYAAALRCDPGFYEAAHNLSNLLLEAELFEEAAQIATYMGDIAHELRVEPVFNAANALASLGELHKAIKLFRYCLSERRDSRIAYNLGLAYASLGQTWTAMDVLQNAIRLAQQEKNEKVRKVAASVYRLLKRGGTYQWQGRSVRVPLSPQDEGDMKQDMEELLRVLAKRGYGSGAKGIRRAVSKVAARVEMTKAEIRAARAPVSQDAAKARTYANATISQKYARLPSYGGG